MTVLLPSGNSTCHPDTDLAFDRTITIFSWTLPLLQNLLPAGGGTVSGGPGPQAVVDPADRRTAGENCPGRELPLCLPVVYSVHRM